MSAAGRKAIAEAQRKRWAAAKVALAEGCAAVIPSPHDAVDAATLQLLAERGVKLIALRTSRFFASKAN
jgi:hypothetical protein